MIRSEFIRGTIHDSRDRCERKRNTFDRAVEDDYFKRPTSSIWFPMAPRSIITLPDSRLRLVSAPLARVDASLRKLIDDMLETMYEAPGIGLAAIQIGEPIRLIVVDPKTAEEPKNPLALVNPEILWSSEERRVYEEGCLSIPEYYEDVERPVSVRARYVDREGKSQEVLAEGLLATVLQHEIDHLNGVLFIDYLSKLKRDRVVKKFAKIARHSGEGTGRL
jgi:peptide deformylase